MISFLFWNLAKKDLSESVANIVLSHGIDVILLVESGISPSALLTKLNIDREEYFCASFTNCEKVQVYTNFHPRYLKTRSESSRYTIRSLALPGIQQVILGVAHLPSKNNRSDSSQILDCTKLINAICEVENQLGIDDTILVGDLNMNPFEDGVVSAGALHATMSSHIAKRGDRVVDGDRYKFFYNPMWNFFGDQTNLPLGTYYYSASEPRSLFWNIFDQVIVRPSLIDKFVNDDLQILSDNGKRSLLTKNGIPNKNLFSDHLPIVFKVNL